jgi:hypothetical protein
MQPFASAAPEKAASAKSAEAQTIISFFIEFPFVEEGQRDAAVAVPAAFEALSAPGVESSI